MLYANNRTLIVVSTRINTAIQMIFISFLLLTRSLHMFVHRA
jgi:hypothetical protein